MKIRVISQQEKEEKDLYRAILKLETDDECNKFFHDILSPKELKRITKRWQIALCLSEKKPKSQRKVAKELHTSTATVGRVKRFLDGDQTHGGYQLVLNKIRK